MTEQKARPIHFQGSSTSAVAVAAQSRVGSLIEVVMNTAIGLVISVIANHYVFPRFGFYPSLGQNILIGVIYTVISIVRSYILRRWFNARLHRLALRMAGTA